MTRFFRISPLLSLSAMIVGTVTVSIIESPSASAQPASSNMLEEVIVNAQRREESAQDVAVSITVFNEEQIANANMTNSADIATYTPSLSTNTRFGNENTSFSIRGFTQALRTAASVGTYFAEVVAPRGQTSQTSGDGAGPGTLFDLQNIQVLKGPQGTLFGRNTTGGAILLMPQKPTEEFEGYLEVTAGSIGTLRQQAALNVPLLDNLALRLGVDNNERDGHLNNVTKIGADELGNTDYTAVRVSALWDISDTMSNYTILQDVDSSSNGYTATLYSCNTNPDPSVNPFFALTGQQCADQLARQRAAGHDDFYDLVTTIATPITNIKEQRAINTFSWDLNENITLKLINAYAHLETENGSDIFGTQFPEQNASPFLMLPASPGAEDREFTVGISVPSASGIPVTSQRTRVHELQFQGVAPDDGVIWAMGLYYEKSSPDGFSGNDSNSFQYCDPATVEMGPGFYNCNDPTNGTLGGILVQEYKTYYLNKAAFAQATFDISDALSLTLGMRYTIDKTAGFGIKKRYTFTGTAPNPVIRTTASPAVDSEAPTGLVEINFRPFEDTMIYAKYIRGYRQGSVNLAADPTLDVHTNETVDSYEIGLKSTFEAPIPGRFNISIFDNELSDMQLQAGYISSTSGPTTAITNAGEAEIKGIEIEAMFQLHELVTLSLSASKLDTELLEQGTINPEVIRTAVRDAALSSGQTPPQAEAAGAAASATFTPIAVVGDELPFAADYSWVASMNFTVPVDPEWGLINVGFTYVYTGEMRAAATGASPDAVLPDFELLNLNASWFSMFGTNLDLTLFGTNVLDEEYLTYVSGTYNTLSFDSRQVGFPRLYGARLRYSF